MMTKRKSLSERVIDRIISESIRRVINENEFKIVKNEQNKFNVQRPDGSLLSPDEWYDVCTNFKDGYLVINGNTYNHLRKDGTKAFPQGTDNVANFVTMPKHNYPNMPTSDKTVHYGQKGNGGLRVINDKNSYMVINRTGGPVGVNIGGETVTRFNNAYVADNGDVYVVYGTKTYKLSPDGTSATSGQIGF